MILNVCHFWKPCARYIRQTINVPSDRELTEKEEQLVIDEAKEEIERRKRKLQENYEEMHAALLKAFPLDEYLGLRASK